MSSDSKPDNSAFSQIVVPLDNEKLAEAFKKFEDFKKKLVTKEDYQEIRDKRYLKKSGCRKWALACSVSDEILDQVRVPSTGTDSETGFYWRFAVRAFHLPTGRSTVGVAIASSSEKGGWAHLEHDVYTLAHTRAKNRAILDLVGGGEVSAEEIVGLNPTTETENDSTITQQATPSPQVFAFMGESKEYPVFHQSKIVGMVHTHPAESKLVVTPSTVINSDAAPIQSFLIPRVLEATRQKHAEFDYSLTIVDGILQSIMLKTTLDQDKVDGLLNRIAWSFAKASEKAPDYSPGSQNR